MSHASAMKLMTLQTLALQSLFILPHVVCTIVSYSHACINLYSMYISVCVLIPVCNSHHCSVCLCQVRFHCQSHDSL